MTSAPDTATAAAANTEGMAAMRAGDPAAAARAFARAAAADPGALPLWANLAHAHRLAGDTAGERAALEAALALDRLDFVTQLRMAQLLQRLGEEQAALQAWSGVAQLAAQLAQEGPLLAPQVAAELAAGQAWSAAVQDRLAARIDQRMAAEADGWTATEQRRIRAFVDLGLGRRQVFRNECAGALYPFLPADEYFDRHHFPWLDRLEAGTGAIRAELHALLNAKADLLRPYVTMDAGTPDNKWTALDGSLDWSACFLWEYGRPNPPVLDLCPQTAALVASLPLAQIEGRAPNVFFSLLRPGSHIPAHTGVTNTRAIIHLALDVPPGCGFRVGGETREWVEGTAFAFDDTIDHEAWNPSDRMRAVLILDTWNPHLSEAEQRAIAAYFATADMALTAGPTGAG